MESENIKLGADPKKSDLSADQRIRISQHGNITKKFIECVGEYQDIQTKYKKKYRDRLARQYKIVKPNVTDVELEVILETGGGEGGTVFAQQIINTAQHAEAKRALHDIQERHQDIIKIEKSILVRISSSTNTHHGLNTISYNSLGTASTVPRYGYFGGSTGGPYQPNW